MSEQPITSLEDAVTALGALPMPAGPVPQPLSDGRFAEIRSRRFDEVTAGPWLVADGADGKPVVYVEEPLKGVAGARVLLVAEGASEADVQFVASARRSVPELVTEVERLRARVAELKAQREADHKTWQHDLRTARDEREATAARVAELEALKPAPIQECRKCGAGYTYGEPCQTCAFRERMAAELKVRGWEDPHDSPLHRAHKVPHDLEWPETGDQR